MFYTVMFQNPAQMLRMKNPRYILNRFRGQKINNKNK